MRNIKDYFSSKVRALHGGDGEVTSSIFDISSEMERNGRKIIHMEIGKPNFDTPNAIKEAAIEAIKQGNVHYTPPAGIFELREAITNRTKAKYGMEYNPKNEALITAGASEALYLIFIAFLNADDEVMIPSPCYYSYERQVECTSAKYVEVPVLKDGIMKYDMAEFEKRITDKTKVLLLNSPNNPTGYVMSDDEIKAMADFVIKHDLIVISDECYEDFQYEGEFMSIAGLPGMKERTLIINSTSKTFSMTGWRVGYILGNADFIECLQNVHEHLNICPTSFAQVGSVRAYAGEIKEVEDMLKKYKRRKEYIVDALNKIDEVSFYEPQGAFYIFINVKKTGMSGTEFCLKLLNETGVAMNPGKSFGEEWNDYIRLSFCCSMEDIIEAMEHIRKFIANIKK